MRASIMRDVQREQRGRSMVVSDGREEIRGMTLPCIWAGACSTLSHRWSRYEAVMEPTCASSSRSGWSKLLTCQNLMNYHGARRGDWNDS
jgi:hypothetical protein